MKRAFLLFLFLCSTKAFAQAPAIQWQKCLGGSGADVGYSIRQTTDGGYIVAGYSNSNDSEVSGNHGGRDYWIVKINDTGAIQWQKSLGGSMDDKAYSLQQTTDGGYIVAGESQSNDGDVSGNHGADNYWVVKLNDTGAILWQKCLGGSTIDVAWSIQQTIDGGYIVAGQVGSDDIEVSGNHGGFDYWVVKLNDTGAVLWQKCLGGSLSDVAYAIQQTTDGGYIVAGGVVSNDSEVSGNHGDEDYWVVKLNDTGAILWQKCLGGSLDDAASSIQQTSDGGYIVAGYTNSNDIEVSGSHGGQDNWVVKLDDTGAIQWLKCLGGSGTDAAQSIRQTMDGGYIVAGQSNSNDGDVSGNHGNFDDWVVKLNDTGAIQWQESLGGSGVDYAYSIQQTTDGGYIVAGFSGSNDSEVSGNHGGSDYWVVKLTCGNPGLISGPSTICTDSSVTLMDTVGGGVWSVRNGNATISAGRVTGIAAGADTAIYTITNTCGTASTSFPFSITLCPSEVKQTPLTNPITIVPNPTTGSISITGISSANIKVYNTLGQLINEASNTDHISIAAFPAGMYFVRVFDGRGALVKEDKIVKE